MATFLYIIGRMLQILALFYLGWALYQGIALKHGGMAEEYKWFGIGIAVFLVGRWVERQWGIK